MGLLSRLFGAGDASDPLPEQAVLIDVRSPAEFASGHIEGALSVPLDRLARDIGRVAPDKDAPLIVYCQSGGRSAAARTYLLGAGYRHVVNGGGVQALAARMQRRLC